MPLGEIAKRVSASVKLSLCFWYSGGMKSSLNPQLLEQIAQFKARKVPRAQVSQVLGNAGWTAEDVEAALTKTRYPAYAPAAAAVSARAAQRAEAERAAEVLLEAERARSGRLRERNEVLHDAAAGSLLPPPVGTIFEMRAAAKLGIAPGVIALGTAGVIILGFLLPAVGTLAGLLWVLLLIYLAYCRYVKDI